MKKLMPRWKWCFISLFVLVYTALPSIASASPFGQGLFGENVPFGSLTSISVNLGGNVNLSLTQNGSDWEDSDSHTITVTSNDVVGYDLYAHTNGSTDMVNGSFTIPASGNTSPGALATNTWGFNTTGSSTNFQGMLATNTLIKDANGPFTTGDNTTVTYGAKTSVTKEAGDYTVNVVYIVVPENQ
jgi:hypothetical protein